MGHAPDGPRALPVVPPSQALAGGARRARLHHLSAGSVGRAAPRPTKANTIAASLSPMFFDAMATGSSSRGEHPVLGFVPYLNGGLFRRSALEDRINDAGEVSLPDEVFDPESDDSLLNLLSRYRFTTRESTPDDQSVDPDPELLGRVFENLYQGDERHATPALTTRRERLSTSCAARHWTAT